jgi:hypothetical protein
LRALDQIVDLLVLPHGLTVNRVLETLERRFEVLEPLPELGKLGFDRIRPAARVRLTGKSAAPEAHGWSSCHRPRKKRAGTQTLLPWRRVDGLLGPTSAAWPRRFFNEPLL